MAALKEATVLALMHGPHPLRAGQLAELEFARTLKKRVVPIVVGGSTPAALPESLRKLTAITVRRKLPKSDLEAVVQGLSRVLDREQKGVAPTDPADPQRGRFGGLSRRNGRELTAVVKEVTADWFEITLTVRPTTDAHPLSGPVEFHLHPTYTPQVQKAATETGVASLTIYGYGAFTVGVVADAGSTTLELDLAADEAFPPVFRSR